MLTTIQAVENGPGDEIDEALSPLLEVAERAVATCSRIPVLSLWNRIPFISLLASHLHLRWPGDIPSLPLTPRIGIFPFFGSDLEILSKPLYHVQSAQTARKLARSKRFSAPVKHTGDLYLPDWEQAIERRRTKLEQLVLPASSFISIDRVTETGEIKQGHREIIGKFAPRGDLKPQLLVPARTEITRQLIRVFDDLDLVIVNVQNIRGERLTGSIEYFLSEISRTIPIVIIASSPADLVTTRALEPPSAKPVIFSMAQHSSSIEVKSVNRDRASLERQFCFAIEGLEERSDALAHLVAQAKRTWWATRQSMSYGTPPEALALEKLYSEILARNPGNDIELLEEGKRLIIQEASNTEVREERRSAVIQAALHDGRSLTALILARSDLAAEELRSTLAAYLSVGTSDLLPLGIQIMNVFGQWPSTTYDACIAAGYFGTATIDMLFASRAAKKVLVVDPIEARIALWDTEKRFCGVPDLPQPIAASLHSLSSMLEPHACPSSEPISLSILFGDRTHSGLRGTIASRYVGTVTYVCICFADGSTQQVPANARFEVLGRKRLQLQTVAAKDLEIGDQVVLLHDDERAAFSEKLLRVMDEGRLKGDSQTRSTWITTVRAVRGACPTPASAIKRRLDDAGIETDLATIRTWLPSASSDDCGVPDHETVFLAFSDALGLSLPTELLREWFVGINRLRIQHRRIGRELVKAIRGAYLGRLDPVTVARMEREWDVQAKTLLEAARVAVVDDVIPFV